MACATIIVIACATIIVEGNKAAAPPRSALCTSHRRAIENREFHAVRFSSQSCQSRDFAAETHLPHGIAARLIDRLLPQYITDVLTNFGVKPTVTSRWRSHRARRISQYDAQ
jgi:hypothetical protein